MYKTKKGATLIVVMIFLLIVTIIATTIISTSSRYRNSIVGRVNTLQETITDSDNSY